MSFLYGFLVGIVAGVVANQVFAMLGRLVQAKWARYRVQICRIDVEDQLGTRECSAVVQIQPPRFKYLFVAPLEEYLLFEVRCADGDWLRSKWDVGDIGDWRLRTDGAMTVRALVYTEHSSRIHLGDTFPDPHKAWDEDGEYFVHLRVTRSVDSCVADEAYFTVSKQGKSVKLGALRR